MSKKKPTPFDLLKSGRDRARAGFVKGVTPIATVRKSGSLPRPKAAVRGQAQPTGAAYVQSMIAGQGARLDQMAPGGPYVGPFRYRPNKMGGYARRDED